MNKIAQKRKIYDVTLKGAVINILLLVSKFCAGIWGHSSAIMADAVHSLSDLLTDIIVLVSVKFGGNPKDDHVGDWLNRVYAWMGVVGFSLERRVLPQSRPRTVRAPRPAQGAAPPYRSV